MRSCMGKIEKEKIVALSGKVRQLLFEQCESHFINLAKNKFLFTGYCKVEQNLLIDKIDKIC